MGFKQMRTSIPGVATVQSCMMRSRSSAAPTSGNCLDEELALRHVMAGAGHVHEEHRDVRQVERAELLLPEFEALLDERREQDLVRLGILHEAVRRDAGTGR